MATTLAIANPGHANMALCKDQARPNPKNEKEGNQTMKLLTDKTRGKQTNENKDRPCQNYKQLVNEIAASSTASEYVNHPLPEQGKEGDIDQHLDD